jgi:hypothetical protein
MAKALDTSNNPTTVIYLDRPRFVRFGHKALKQLTTLTGMKLEEMDEDDFSMEELEKIMWCGLQTDAQQNNEVLKLEDMEDLLDKAESFNEIMEVMKNALEKAFQQTEKQKN